MKTAVVILILGLILQSQGFAQGITEFYVNFNGNPPPHTPGVPDSGARLTDDSFYAAIYLDVTSPVSGFISKKSGDGSFTPVFQFTNLIFAAYPSPPAAGPALDYEGTWQLTNPQIQDLLNGLWYAQINYADTTYMGQFTPVPEPSGVGLFLGGIASFLICRRIYSRRVATNGDTFLGAPMELSAGFRSMP